MTLVRVNTKKYAPNIPQSSVVNAEFILSPILSVKYYSKTIDTYTKNLKISDVYIFLEEL